MPDTLKLVFNHNHLTAMGKAWGMDDLCRLVCVSRFFANQQTIKQIEIQRLQEQLPKNIFLNKAGLILRMYNNTCLTVYPKSLDELEELDFEDTKPQADTVIPNETIVNQVTNQESFFYITASGNVFASGANHVGQLGLGHFNDCSSPQRVSLPNNERIRRIVLGTNHTFFITEQGKVWGCGDHRSGQLGLGVAKIDRDDKVINVFAIPQLITIPRARIIDVAACGNNSVFLTEDGTILGCGDNEEKQLNESTRQFIPTPISITPTLIQNIQARIRKIEMRLESSPSLNCHPQKAEVPIKSKKVSFSLKK